MKKLLAVALLLAAPVLAQVRTIPPQLSGGSTFTGGTITTPILAAPGTCAGAIPYSFTGFPTSGFAHTTPADNLLLCVGTATIMTIAADVRFAGQIRPTFSGSAAAPSIGLNASDTGFFRSGASSIGFASGGVEIGTWSGSAFLPETPVNVTDGDVTIPGLAFASDADGTGTGFYRTAANSIGITTNGVLRQTINTAAITSTIPVVAPAGLITANGIGIGAGNTGFYVRSSVVLESVIAGTSYFGVDSAKTTVNSGQQYAWSSGSLTSSGADTGLARSSAGIVKVTTGGANRGTLDTLGIQGFSSKALTETSATNFATVAVPQTAGANFAGGEVIYTVYETDATDSTTLSGSAKFAAVNKAGTESCAAIADVQTAAISTGAFTLTCTMTCVTGLTDVVALAMNCTDAGTMTQSTLNILYRFNQPQPNVVIPQ